MDVGYRDAKFVLSVAELGRTVSGDSGAPYFAVGW